MKKKLPFLFIAIVVSAQLLAQPSQIQVKTDFLKNGVTAVEGITTEKEAYKDYSVWKASFKTVLPVSPEEVNGVAGVTLVRHMVANYVCTGTNCKKTWSELTHSEYKGIDLPAPASDTLTKIIWQKIMTEPSELVVSMLNKVSFDSVKANEPKIDWINPNKLQFSAKIYYKEKTLSVPGTGVYESPVLVTLQRENTKSAFKIYKATQLFERTIELAHIKKPVTSGKTETPPPTPAPARPVAGAWKSGDKVMVEDNGKWYPSTVLHVRDKEWYIHNDEYDSKYDMWVVAARIKNK